MSFRMGDFLAAAALSKPAEASPRTGPGAAKQGRTTTAAQGREGRRASAAVSRAREPKGSQATSL